MDTHDRRRAVPRVGRRGVRRGRPRRVRARRAGAAAAAGRRRPGGPGAARQRRLRHGHRRDHQRGGARRRRARAGRRPAEVLVGGLGLGFTLHRGARRPAGRALHGRRDRAGARRLDARRDHPARPDPAGRRARQPSSSPTCRSRSPRRARRRTTWCCSTSTTAPATWSTRATPRSTSEPFLGLTRRILRPGGALAIWSADEAPGLEAVDARRCSTRSSRCPTPSTSRTARRLLALVGRVAQENSAR